MKVLRGLAAAAGLGLAACTTAASIPDHPNAVATIVAYYDRNAWEQDARCVLPKMNVTDTTVLENTPDRLKVEVRYFWKDNRADTDTRGNNCRGFASRTFTLAQGEVVAMTGEQR